MLTPLFLAIDESDIFLILFYFILHLLSLVFFILGLTVKKAKLKKVALVIIGLQCVFDAVVIASFFNPFSIVSLVVGIVFMILVFRVKPKTQDS